MNAENSREEKQAAVQKAVEPSTSAVEQKQVNEIKEAVNEGANQQAELQKEVMTLKSAQELQTEKMNELVDTLQAREDRELKAEEEAAKNEKAESEKAKKEEKLTAKEQEKLLKDEQTYKTVTLTTLQESATSSIEMQEQLTLVNEKLDQTNQSLIQATIFLSICICVALAMKLFYEQVFKW